MGPLNYVLLCNETILQTKLDNTSNNIEDINTEQQTMVAPVNLNFSTGSARKAKDEILKNMILDEGWKKKIMQEKEKTDKITSVVTKLNKMPKILIG